MLGSWAVKTAVIIVMVAGALVLRLGWEVAVREYQAKKPVIVAQDEWTSAAFALPRIGGGGRGGGIPGGGGGGGGGGDIDIPDVDVPSNRNEGNDANVPTLNDRDRNDGDDSSTSVPNLGGGSPCSTGVRNVPVVPFSSGDGDGDGVACEEDTLFLSGGPGTGPVPTLPSGVCPQEYPDRHPEGCYAP